MSELDLDAIEAGARAALEEVPDPRARGWRPGASEKHVYVPYAEALEGPNGERVLLRDRILLGDTEWSLRMNPHFAHEKVIAHIARMDPSKTLALCGALRSRDAQIERLEADLDARASALGRSEDHACGLRRTCEEQATEIKRLRALLLPVQEAAREYRARDRSVDAVDYENMIVDEALATLEGP